jgi:hypothetical protein
VKRKQGWLGGLAVLIAIAIIVVHPLHLNAGKSGVGMDRSVAIAQTPPASPTPGTPGAPGNPTISPSVPNPGSPSFTIPVSPSIVPAPPAPPASNAKPAELSSTYQDAIGRFKVGILKNYTVTPMAGSILVEAPDGNLAYSVIPQSQPLGNPIGLSTGYDNSESLAKIATAAFQRGEGFQPGPPQPEAGGGAIMNWTGDLTIAGKTQPVGGVVLMRPSSKMILLLVVTATQAGADRIPAAVAALANNLEAL